MLHLGQNITQANDKLTPLTPDKLYALITLPQSAVKDKITMLRSLMAIDEKQYRQLKTQLPYITCGVFEPPFRRQDNFASISCFIVDIDHVTNHDFNLQLLKEKLASDTRVAMLFNSPGNNGLKLLFFLQQKCYDKGKFSLFYKHFTQAFARQYEINNLIDFKTSDVTRACFLSFDSEAWYNPEAEKIDMDAIIDFENPTQIKLITTDIAMFESELPAIPQNSNKQELDSDVWLQIRQKLNPAVKSKPEKQIYVPQKINEIIDIIEQAALEHQIKLTGNTAINYGRKFKFEFNTHWAEINVFYGQRGYSVVKSPKRGSSTELLDIVNQIICNVLF